MGTTVEGGRGEAVIAATGMATELGKIATLVQQETKEETPLQRQLDRLGKPIGAAGLALAVVVFAVNVGGDSSPGQGVSLFAATVWRATPQVAFFSLTAVGPAVAAIPEGLPAVVTICLALGLQRMV